MLLNPFTCPARFSFQSQVNFYQEVRRSRKH
nr:MAG TPA: hypothetical protein [Caudoviricetes sp.]